MHPRTWKISISGILLAIIGIGIGYFLGLERPYPAFGGEDILAIALVVYGLFPERKRENGK